MPKKNPYKNIKSHTFGKAISYKWLYIIGISILVMLLPVQNGYALRSIFETYETQTELVPPIPASVPVDLHISSPPDLSAEAIAITDVGSNVRMYQKNANARLYPASITKIMTALVAQEAYRLEEVVTVEKLTDEGQVMGLKPNESITVENLLYGILVHSANDAAYVLAAHYPRGVAGFVQRMNEKAFELNLKDTHFANPSGLDDPENYSTASDISTLSIFALKNPVISKIVSVPQITVSDINFVTFHNLKNVNELLGKIPGVSGFKTGFTQTAGQSLVTTVQRNNHKIIIVVLKSTDRFKETEELVTWVFPNFAWQELGPKEMK